MKIRENLAFLLDRPRTKPHALASECGVPQRTIHRILTGESDAPRTHTLTKIAAHFGLSATDLRENDLATTSPAIALVPDGTVGARMRAARERAGMTQQAIGEAIGVTKAAVSNFENGQNMPAVDTLVAFAKVTGSSVDALLGLQGEQVGQRPRIVLASLFARNVQRLIDHQGLSTHRAARDWGVPTKTLESLVKQERTPTLDTAEAIAHGAGVDVRLLLSQEFDPSGDQRFRLLAGNADDALDVLVRTIALDAREPSCDASQRK